MKTSSLRMVLDAVISNDTRTKSRYADVMRWQRVHYPGTGRRRLRGRERRIRWNTQVIQQMQLLCIPTKT
jgi:hypothetical protein